MSGVLHSGIAHRSKKTKGKVLTKLLDSLICSICHDYMFVPMMTQCGHNFCYSCITSWFESNTTVELTCPHCRTSISEEPHLNSTLQQLLGSVFESLNNKESTKDSFESLQKAKVEAEAEYKFDNKNDNMFNDIFKRSAVGVIDEDDDGILRCSNCHWELEDDDDEICPHCNSRIRSRMRSDNAIRNRNSEVEDEVDDAEDEDDEDEDDDQGDVTERLNDRELDEVHQSILKYKADVRNCIEEYRNSDISMLLQLETQFPHVVDVDWSSASKIYFPSYSIYSRNDLTLNEEERERKASLAKKIELIDKEGGDIAQLRRSTPQQRYNASTGYYSEGDFSESDDDNNNVVREPSAGGVVDLEAKDSREEEEEDYDSEFYENNEEDDGFVTGDSLDDDTRGEDEYMEDDYQDAYGPSDHQSDENEYQSDTDREKEEFSDDEDDEIEALAGNGSASKRSRLAVTTKGGDGIHKGGSNNDDEDEGDEDEDILRLPKRRYQILSESSDEE